MATRQFLLRTRSRIAFSALAAAMSISTLVVGLEHSSFVAKATGTQAAIATPVAELGGAPIVAVVDSAAAASTADFSVLDVNVENTRVDDWVRRLTTSLRGDFSMSLDRMDRYSAMINKKLDEKQMPRELIYLALIESNFNPNARSKVGAVGMWQFMSATAREFGLTVTRRTDERKNPAEATDAALTYLGQLHERFGSWYLAAAAYNSGQGTVSRALKKVTGKTTGTDEDFFRILSSLPRETQDYVPKLIASARVGSDPERYGMSND